jgi:hypothetical protein
MIHTGRRTVPLASKSTVYPPQASIINFPHPLIPPPSTPTPESQRLHWIELQKAAADPNIVVEETWLKPRLERLVRKAGLAVAEQVGRLDRLAGWFGSLVGWLVG